MLIRSMIFGMALTAFVAPATAQAPQATLLVAATPQDKAVIAGPVNELTITFNRDVDLVHLDVELPDESKVVLFDVFERGDAARKGKTFTLALPAPLATSGQYYLNYAVSVTNPGSTDAIAGFTGFEIEAPAEPADEPGPSGDSTP